MKTMLSTTKYEDLNSSKNLKRKRPTDNSEESKNTSKVPKPCQHISQWSNGTTVVEDIAVSNDVVSLIIGKGGSMHKRLEEVSGARVHITPKPTTSAQKSLKTGDVNGS